MKTALLFDFIVDKDTKTISVKREFAATKDLVWDAWTKPELLDQWWAPRPYRTVTKSMNFKEGGSWFYSMVGPEGDTHWCKANYKKISSGKSFTYQDAFCDDKGVENTQLPSTQWATQFTAYGDSTVVDVKLVYETVEDLERIIQMGFKEGFTMALGNLDEIFEKGKK